MVERQGRADQSGGYAAEMESTIQGGGQHASSRGRGGTVTKGKRKSKNWPAASKLGNTGDDSCNFFINFWRTTSKLGNAEGGSSHFFIKFWCNSTV